jgi:Tfp pilus assembly protein PilN
MLPDIDYQALNERVEQQLQKRKRFVRYIMFAMSIFMVVLFSIIAWGIYSGSEVALAAADLPTENPTDAAMVMLTLGGIMAVMMNGIGLMVDSGIGDKQMRSQVLSEELGQAVKNLAMSQSEKPKRSAETNLSDAQNEQVMEISDDGELVPVERRSRNQ